MLSLDSYILEGSISSQKHSDFHSTHFSHSNQFTEKCCVQKMCTTDEEECIALSSFVLRNQINYIHHKCLKNIYKMFIKMNVVRLFLLHFVLMHLLFSLLSNINDLFSS